MKVEDIPDGHLMQWVNKANSVTGFAIKKGNRGYLGLEVRHDPEKEWIEDITISVDLGDGINDGFYWVDHGLACEEVLAMREEIENG